MSTRIKWKVGEEDSQRSDMKSYIEKFYPDVFLNHRAENKSGKGLTGSYQQGINYGMPDEEYFAARGKYHGMHLEQKILKKDPFRWLPKKKCRAIENERYRGSGMYTQDAEHIRRQAYQMSRLNKAGYFACFAVGLKENQDIADWYLNGAKEKQFEWYEFQYTPPGGYFPEKHTIPIWQIRQKVVI